jgi:hypothetical protein
MDEESLDRPDTHLETSAVVPWEGKFATWAMLKNRKNSMDQGGKNFTTTVFSISGGGGRTWVSFESASIAD